MPAIELKLKILDVIERLNLRNSVFIYEEWVFKVLKHEPLSLKESRKKVSFMSFKEVNSVFTKNFSLKEIPKHSPYDSLLLLKIKPTSIQKIDNNNKEKFYVV